MYKDGVNHPEQKGAKRLQLFENRAQTLACGAWYPAQLRKKDVCACGSGTLVPKLPW